MLKFFRIPFAESGDLAPVPDDLQVNGEVSYTQGFGPDYALDPALGGDAKRIERDQYNQVLLSATAAIQELQSQGLPDFITAALNGGAAYPYAIGATVFQPADNKVYRNTVAANVTVPPNTGWRDITTPLTADLDANITATYEWQNNVKINLGNNIDGSIYSNGTDVFLDLDAAADFRLRDNGTLKVVFDNANNQFDFNTEINMGNQSLEFGANDDLSIRSDGANAFFDLDGAADLSLRDNGTTKVKFDLSADTLIFDTKCDFNSTATVDAAWTYTISPVMNFMPATPRLAALLPWAQGTVAADDTVIAAIGITSVNRIGNGLYEVNFNTVGIVANVKAHVTPISGLFDQRYAQYAVNTPTQILVQVFRASDNLSIDTDFSVTINNLGA